MTRAEFIKAIAQGTKLDVEVVATVIFSAEDVLMDNLRSLEEVRPFEGIRIVPRVQKGSVRLNPRTMDKIMTKDHLLCKAIFSQAFYKRLNEKEEG